MSRSRAMLMALKTKHKEEVPKSSTEILPSQEEKELSTEPRINLPQDVKSVSQDDKGKSVLSSKERVLHAKKKLRTATKVVGTIAAQKVKESHSVEQVKNDDDKKKSKSKKRRHSSFNENIILDYESREAVDRFWRSVFMTTEEQQKLSIGEIEVRIIEAVHLPAADFGGLSDPYIVVRLTGRNRWGQYWLREQRWRTRTIKKNLNPQFYESTTFRVPRFDSILRFEVYDADETSKDDFLGFSEIKICELHGLGNLKRWWPLRVNPKYLKKKTTIISPTNSSSTNKQQNQQAAIHLNVRYDCNKLGEAMSLLWAPEPRRKAHKSFEVNELLHNSKLFQHELVPYLNFFHSVDHVLTWKQVSRSLAWLLISLVFVILSIQQFFVVVHELIAVALIISGFRLAQLTQIRDQAQKIFQAIDTDGSNSLDRNEIGIALEELTNRLKGKALSPEAIDALFLQHDKDNSGHLEFDEFFELLTHCPEIVGTMLSSFKESTGEDEFDNTDNIIPDDTQHEYEEYDDDEASIISSISPGGAERDEFTEENTPEGGKKRLRFLPKFGHKERNSEDLHSTGSKPTSSEIDGKQIKGASRVVANMVGRRLGPTATFVVTQLGDRAKDLILIRDLFNWKDPQLSMSAVIGNFFMAWVHARVDPRLVWSIFTILIFLQRTHLIQALIRIGTKGPTALQRYLSSEDELRAKSRKLLSQAGSTLPLKRQQTAKKGILRGSNVKSVQMRALRLVLQSIFSHLDADGSGQVSSEELESFVLKALRHATRAAKQRAGLLLPQGEDFSNAAAIQKRVQDILNFDEYDTNGDGGIDYKEFTDVVIKSGCAEILMQDELHRQLMSHAGFKCIKWPTNRTIGSVLATHSTCLNLHRRKDKQGYDLSYTNRRGQRVQITRNDIQDVTTAKTNDHFIDIRHAHTNDSGRMVPNTPKSAGLIHRHKSIASSDTLRLSVATILREPLCDLLRARLMDGEIPTSTTFDRSATISDDAGGDDETASNPRESSSLHADDTPSSTFFQRPFSLTSAISLSSPNHHHHHSSKKNAHTSGSAADTVELSVVDSH